MFLEKVHIRRFRSINSLDLDRCRSLNILIGKNNAGKSAILSAINTFFRSVKGGRLVFPNAPIAREITFFNKDTREPIEISLSFSLTESERKDFLDDVMAAAPQVKNTLEGLDPCLWLLMTLSVHPPPLTYSVVSRIGLIRPSSGDTTPGIERLFFDVQSGASQELNTQAARVSQLTSDARALRQLTERVPANFFRGNVQEREQLPYFLRSYLPDNPQLIERVIALIRSGPDDEISASKFINLANEMDREAQAANQASLKTTVTTISGEEKAVPGYVWKLLKKMGDFKVLYLEERRKAIGEQEAQQLLELKMSRGGPEVLKHIQETVATLLGVQIDAFRGDSRSRSASEAELDVDNFLVQVNGSGVRESLRMILDNEFEKPSLLLVEEPEIHLHPALETSIMRYLQRASKSCQVFLTTHSTNFLDTAELTNVYLVTKDTSTHVQLMDLESAESLLPRELGLRMSSLFLYDRLVFVEGTSDEAIIREWASILKVNLGYANVGFVKMGGARNFSHYAAAATLSFLAKRNVQSWILLDRDERGDQEIEKFRQLVGGTATVKVLEHREIENLLLNPRAILALIKAKLPANAEAVQVSEQNVRDAIEGAIEKLKTFAVAKKVSKEICVPLFPANDVVGETDGNFKEKILADLDRRSEMLARAHQTFDEVYRTVSEEISSNWPTQKTQLVPGELAIDLTMQKFGLRFNKSLDGPRLASLMREDDIDVAMRSFIRELGAAPANRTEVALY